MNLLHIIFIMKMQSKTCNEIFGGYKEKTIPWAAPQGVDHRDASEEVGVARTEM